MSKLNWTWSMAEWWKTAQVQQKIMHTEIEKEIQMANDTYSLVGNQVYSLSSVSSSFPASWTDMIWSKLDVFDRKTHLAAESNGRIGSPTWFALNSAFWAHLRSCLAQTSPDKAESAAAVLSWRFHSIWPVPHVKESATAEEKNIWSISLLFSFL